VGFKDFIPLKEMISLKGKVALITGSASGIGEAIAYRFAEAGADLFLVDINEENLKRVSEAISSRFGIKVENYVVDLSKKEDIDKLWESLKGKEPDILVNNAGIYIFKDFLDIDESFLEKNLAINLKSAFWMCQYMVKRRANKGGIIVNIGSIEAILPFASGLVHYDITKSGIISMSRALAREYGKKGFRVNVVVPGGIETPGVKEKKKDAFLKLNINIIKSGMNYLSRLPLGRLGKPDEVARVVLFLSSPLSSYIQGAVIPVDGGFLSA